MCTKRDLNKPYKLLLTKCKGVLQEPVSNYGKYAYWHGNLATDPNNTGWWSKPATGQKA